jgi:NADH:ubiquinone oxidoreductase subunit 5 (subunit L)/multisubunit Na+/H+ antiporter MnhA subunit
MEFLTEHPGLWFVAATLLPLVSVVLLLLGGFLRNALRSTKNTEGLGKTLFYLLGGEVTGRGPAYIATAAIALAFVCSSIGFVTYLATATPHHATKSDHPYDHDHDKKKDAKETEHKHAPKWAGSIEWLSVTPRSDSPDKERGRALKIGYYIDHLSAIMFVMVTFIATLIHLFSIGYMSDELQLSVEDHQVHTDHGHFHRRGRFGRFFLFLSMFSFSMLNLILADNLFQVFVSWELVGVCSYLLIGFYYERTSAGNAANKAFITNRVGDAGFIIGVVILWTYVGTLNFQEIFERIRCPEKVGATDVALAWQVVGADMELPMSDGEHGSEHGGVLKIKGSGEPAEYALLFPRHLEHADRLGAQLEEAEGGMRIKHFVPGGPADQARLKPGDVILEVGTERALKKVKNEEEYHAALEKVKGADIAIKRKRGTEVTQVSVKLGSAFPGAGGSVLAEQYPDPDSYGYIPYWMLVTAGLGIFLGCVGKSAQFPLSVWLPDAMEGPTPVSALIHAATMVAAGVYLVGRCFPLFTYEVSLTIAYTGAITLFMAASIAVVMTDIKKVLAYSTVSQLGYMMLAIGVGGWVAGLFHLITHAFFKALLFLGSGSVIHGCHHEQEMTKMGGLFGKMKITALTMLMGVLAIAGIPLFSGWYSKDAVLAHCLGFSLVHNEHFLLFLLPLSTAGITTFYMFRMWFMTFTGKPRDEHVHEHAKESPLLMTVPLIALAFFAVAIGWGWPIWDPMASWLEHQIHHSQPKAVLGDFGGYAATNDGHIVDDLSTGPEYTIEGLNPRAQAYINHNLAGNIALASVLLGLTFAFLIYYRKVMNPADAVGQFPGAYRFLQNKWYVDELYSAMLVRPSMVLAGCCRWFDTTVIDGVLHMAAKVTVLVSFVSGLNDRRIVDGLANTLAGVCQGVGNWLKGVQTGYIRSYVLFLVLAAIGLWILLSVMMGAPSAAV